MPIRRGPVGGNPFGLPPITWRDTTPFAQAAWRRAYGCTTSGTACTSVLDCIRPQSKQVPAAQYLRRAPSIARRPTDLGDSFGVVRALDQCFQLTDRRFLGFYDANAPWTLLFCWRPTAYVGLSQIFYVTRFGAGPWVGQFAAAGFAEMQRPLGGSTCRTLAPVAGATEVMAFTFDNVTFTGYTNGVVGTAVGGPFTALSPIEDSWGAPVPAIASGATATLYEMMFCAGALTGPQVATASGLMLADYPP